jgi:hypothetical protein
VQPSIPTLCLKARLNPRKFPRSCLRNSEQHICDSIRLTEIDCHPVARPLRVLLHCSGLLPTQARDAQQSRHEIPRTYESYRITEDTIPEDLYIPEMVKSRQVNSDSGDMDQLSHIHYAVHSNLLTNTLGNLQHALGHEQRQSYPPLSVDCKSGTPHFRIDRLEERTPSINQHLLQRWVYETSNANITFAERLEKSNWEGARMQKL